MSRRDPHRVVRPVSRVRPGRVRRRGAVPRIVLSNPASRVAVVPVRCRAARSDSRVRPDRARRRGAVRRMPPDRTGLSNRRMPVAVVPVRPVAWFQGFRRASARRVRPRWTGPSNRPAAWGAAGPVRVWSRTFRRRAVRPGSSACSGQVRRRAARLPGRTGPVGSPDRGRRAGRRTAPDQAGPDWSVAVCAGPIDRRTAVRPRGSPGSAHFGWIRCRGAAASIPPGPAGPPVSASPARGRWWSGHRAGPDRPRRAHPGPVRCPAIPRSVRHPDVGCPAELWSIGGRDHPEVSTRPRTSTSAHRRAAARRANSKPGHFRGIPPDCRRTSPWVPRRDVVCRANPKHFQGIPPDCRRISPSAPRRAVVDQVCRRESVLVCPSGRRVVQSPRPGRARRRDVVRQADSRPVRRRAVSTGPANPRISPSALRPAAAHSMTCRHPELSTRSRTSRTGHRRAAVACAGRRASPVCVGCRGSQVCVRSPDVPRRASRRARCRGASMRVRLRRPDVLRPATPNRPRISPSARRRADSRRTRHPDVMYRGSARCREDSPPGCRRRVVRQVPGAVRPDAVRRGRHPGVRERRGAVASVRCPDAVRPVRPHCPDAGPRSPNEDPADRPVPSQGSRPGDRPADGSVPRPGGPARRMRDRPVPARADPREHRARHRAAVARPGHGG